MKIIDDGIHNCNECKIYKEYGYFCSLQPELKVPSCKYCDTRMCCISPLLALMDCEQNTILDKVNEGEYVECKGIIPFNIKTKYCKHIDMKTMKCKVYNQRPVACRIAGHECLSDFWVKAIKEQHKQNKSIKNNII